MPKNRILLEKIHILHENVYLPKNPKQINDYYINITITVHNTITHYKQYYLHCCYFVLLSRIHNQECWIFIFRCGQSLCLFYNVDLIYFVSYTYARPAFIICPEVNNASTSHLHL